MGKKKSKIKSFDELPEMWQKMFLLLMETIDKSRTQNSVEKVDTKAIKQLCYHTSCAILDVAFCGSKIGEEKIDVERFFESIKI